MTTLSVFPRLFIICVAFLFVGSSFSLSASKSRASGPEPGNWMNWRGPLHNGSSSGKQRLPVKFDGKKGFKWKASLPGASAATPIIYNDYVFVSSIEDAKDSDKKGAGNLLALCFDREKGTLLWKRNAGSGYRPGAGDGSATQLHSRSNYASPSAVTDGKRVIFFSAMGTWCLLALVERKNGEGTRRKTMATFVSSGLFPHPQPCTTEGCTYPYCSETSRCMDAANPIPLLPSLHGSIYRETIWQHVCPSKANKESLESFATIIL